jgi:hypothetical protein
LRALAQSETAVFAPVTGVIFAIVLSAMFAGEVVSGTLFPDVDNHGPWFFTLWSATEMAKWLLWAFIAGFSERLVPDMLNSFEKKAGEKAAAPMPAGATNSFAVTTSSVAAQPYRPMKRVWLRPKPKRITVQRPCYIRIPMPSQRMRAN